MRCDTTFPLPGKGPRLEPGLARARPAAAFALAVVCAVAVGCASTKYVKVRAIPQNPLVDSLKLTKKVPASDRTLQVLRQYDLDKELKGDSRKLLNDLQAVIDREPSAEKLYSFAELSYRAGLHFEKKDKKAALDYYGAAVAYAYGYLFDPRINRFRNPYDPQFRGASDLYNGALEAALRIDRAKDFLMPGKSHVIETATQKINVTVVARGTRWKNEDFQRFEFVSDYEVQGLTNQYRTYGLGVPLIAVRKRGAVDSPMEKFYPPSLSFPVTAFLRMVPQEGVAEGSSKYSAVIELYDPLESTDITVADRLVPLETDLSTPLGYFLNNPDLNNPDLEKLATLGLLRPDKTAAITGLYMLQPYEPGKIPVVMVHGLWSSPLTWTQMFNDLRSDPEIGRRYQFWFYLYPTGQPFWNSATQFRSDLVQARKVLDPQQSEPALDQMVLVGHSMGGLVSKLQTVYSQDDFWQIASDKKFDVVQASYEEKQKLENLFYFEPNRSVRRVITIGTPHRGSSFASDTTRYLAQKLITLPQMMSREDIVSKNPDVFKDASIVEMKTSLDSLSPSCPVLSVTLKARKSEVCKYHNIVGVVPATGIIGALAPKDSDGVVKYESAHLDDVASEIVVPADHSTVHSHPRSVLEVRRILLEHLGDLNRTFGPPPAEVIHATRPETSATR